MGLTESKNYAYFKEQNESSTDIYVYTLESSQDSDRQHLEVNTMKSKGGIPV